jgi:hypothetical protein
MFGKKKKNKRSLFDRIFGVTAPTADPIVISVVTDVEKQEEIPSEKNSILSYPDFSQMVVESLNEQPLESSFEVLEQVDSPQLEDVVSYPDFSEMSAQEGSEQPTISIVVENGDESIQGSVRSIKPHRYISDEERFVLVSGEKLQTLHELRDTLRGMPTHVWKAHVSPERNDFANWIEYVSQDPLLSYHCRACPTPEALRALLSVSL